MRRLNHTETEETSILRKVRDRGVTVLLVEHDMAVMRQADRVFVRCRRENRRGSPNRSNDPRRRRLSAIPARTTRAITPEARDARIHCRAIPGPFRNDRAALLRDVATIGDFERLIDVLLHREC